MNNLSLLGSVAQRSESGDEFLSDDIMIDELLSDVDSPLSAMIDLVLANQDGVLAAKDLAPMSPELAELQTVLRKHINVYANQLQLSAQRCSK